MLGRAAIGLINGYQRHISPRKGFSCAYRIRHNDTVGCSGFAKNAIRAHGVWHAFPLIKDRFAACKDAAFALSQAQSNTNEPDALRKRRNRWRLDCAEGCCMASETCRAGPSKKPGAGNCDATPDCAPDCAPCSCGS